MTQEAANTLIQFRTNNVFELAGLAVGFVLVDAEGVLEKPFREPVPPHYVPRAALPPIGELHLVIFSYGNQPQILHARQCSHRVHAARSANMFHVRAVPLFAADPDLFQQMVKVNTVIHGDTLIDSQMPVSQLDLAIRLLRNIGVMSNH